MKRELCAGLLAVGALAASAHANLTVEVIDGAYGTSLSSDGSVMAGNLQGNYETFRWTQAGGIEPLGMSSVEVLGRGAGTPDISDDGMKISATILGADSTYMTAGIWSEAEGWTESMPPMPPDGGPLDEELGSGWGISGDGTTLVGLYWRIGQPGGSAHALKWSEAGGAVGLGSGPGSGRANDCNDDGSVIVGWTESTFGNWRSTVWVDGVMTVLEDTGGFCEASAVTPDGTTIFGETYEIHGSHFYGAAWDWDGAAWNKRILGALPGTAPDQGHVVPNDCTPDGRLVVGFNSFFWQNSTGFVWTEETGIVDVVDFLAERGYTFPASFDPQSATAISDDGSTLVVVGQSMQPPFNAQTYVFQLDGGLDAPIVAGAGDERYDVRAWPNPTRGATSFAFELPRAGRADLAVHDATGRLVHRVVTGDLSAGRHEAAWDGRDDAGRKVAAGVYFYSFESAEGRQSRKLVVVR